jgi:predicted RNase H-like HicB family nuclease
MQYSVVVERGKHNYSAYVPDLPGCVTTGRTLEEVRANISEAIAGHLEIMREYGDPIPEPSTHVYYITPDGSAEPQVK